MTPVSATKRPDLALPPRRCLGSFTCTDLTVTTHQHLPGAVTVHLTPAGTQRQFQVRVLHGAATVFDPAWSLADLVFACALPIGASS